MEPMAEIKINRLPVRTWNRLGMNESVLEEEDAKRLGSAEQKAPVKAFSAQNEETEGFYHMACEDGENKTQEAELTAEQGSRLTVWMDIASPEKAEGLFALTTTIKAGKDARVRLVQVQLLGSGYRFINDIKLECAQGAELELLQLFLGGSRTWAGFQGSLDGAESGLSAELGYWCRNAQRLDMNYVVLHKERMTKSRILTKGVLADRAFKLFRGTIDFRQGASGSEGEETEEVLMLGEDAVNQTIPLILCGEEDVLGNHGATIGEPDEEVLFYLASRGIAREEAAALLARSKIDGLRRRIGNGELEDKVQKYLEEVSGNE